MLRILVYLLFILSVAFASAGIVLSSRLRNRYKSGYFTTLLYFQVFIFTFGFYGIWGQPVIKTFLADYVTPESISRFTDISILLGLPFLVFGWLMLIRLALEISGKKGNNWLVIWFLLVNFLIILSMGFFVTNQSEIKPLLLFRYYFIILNCFYATGASIIIVTTGKNRSALLKRDAKITAFTMIFIMALQAITLYFYESQEVGMVFILTFFAGNSFLPLFLTYGATKSFVPDNALKDISFDDFCKRYEISPRESDIIREICEGLSNKEISDRLFISLQTVKDHTHRIYIKTNVRSRSQLMNIVKNIRGLSN